jgi:PTS system nitrogen regulatory IIA component
MHDMKNHSVFYVAELNVNSVREAYRQIAQHVSSQSCASEYIDPAWLYDMLQIITKQDHAGIGRGLAIPQGRINTLNAPMSIVTTLKKPIDFDALDRQPVDLIFITLSPEKDVKGHLNRLAHISRLLKDKALCDRLRGADSSDAVKSILMNEDLDLLKIAA